MTLAAAVPLLKSDCLSSHTALPPGDPAINGSRSVRRRASRGEGPTNAVVIQGAGQAEPVKEVVAGPDVVAGEDVQPPQPPQEDVFPGPASYAANSQEAVQGDPVGLGRQRFQIQ